MVKSIFFIIVLVLFSFYQVHAQDSVSARKPVIENGTRFFSLSTYPALWSKSKGIPVNLLGEYGRCFSENWAWSAGLITVASLPAANGSFLCAAGPYGGIKYYFYKANNAAFYGLVSTFAYESFSFDHEAARSSTTMTIVPSYGVGGHYFVNSNTALTASVEGTGMYEANDLAPKMIFKGGLPELTLKIGVSFFYNKQH